MTGPPVIPANPAVLQFCWHLRVGMIRAVDVRKLKAYADFFFTTYLEPHLAGQEQLIASAPGTSEAEVKKILSSHRRLRRLFEKKSDPEKVCSQIEDALEYYVRLEQKLLFGRLYSSLAFKDVDSSELGRVLYNPELAENLTKWKDKYWVLD